jgi:hypothetical protein
VLGQFLMLERHHDLQDTGDAGGRLQMPDVRLGRADQQRPVGVTAPAEHGRRGLDLDGITEGCPGAVRLQVVDVGRADAGGGERLGDHPLLCDTVGHGQTA